MKKTTTFIILLLCGGSLSAQINYTDLNPDLTLDILMDNYGSLDVDIDGDQANDFKLVCTNYPSFSLWNIGAQQLDTNNPKIEFLIDKSIAASQIGDYYMKILSNGDAIDASGAYSSDYPLIGDIYNQHFLGQGAKYIGFRLVSGSDYKYGWMAVELSGSGDMLFTMMELAYDNTVNNSINAGAGALSDTEFKITLPMVWTFPNPSDVSFEITCQENCQFQRVEIFNLDGKLVYQNDTPQLPIQVDAQNWESATYLIKILDADGSWHSNRWVKY